MTSEPTSFDPEAPLPGQADPWEGSAMPMPRSGPPYAMTEMIAAEPALAERLLGRLAASDSSAAVLARMLEEAATAGRSIRVVGCGTSEHGAMAAALILEDALRRSGHHVPVVAEQAFEAWLDARPDGLVIGISHEGGTAATNAALQAARASGARTAMVTVGERSPGAALADVVVATQEMDQSWCHTVGYLSPILAALAVAGHLTGDAPDPASIRAALAKGADQAVAAEGIAARLAGVAHLLTVASGVDRPAARELALKVEEAAWLPATMRELETLLHVHLPATDAGTGLVLILSDVDRLADRAGRASEALEAAEIIGLRVAAILSPEADAALAGAPTGLGRLMAARPGLAGPGAAIVATATPSQLLTERLARARGTDPDPIRRDQPRYRHAAERHR